MKDERLDELLRDARAGYRTPPAADLDTLWGRIERDAFDAPGAVTPVVADVLAIDGVPTRPPRRRGWWIPAAGIAATLLLGIGIGRATAPDVPAETPIVAERTPETSAPASNVPDPLQRVTYEYVARTVALLDSLPYSTQAARLSGDERFVADAAQLLGTTRLLLDSPAARDPRLRDLLEDLELVLAQVASLRTAPRAEELTFIADAVTERAVVPRLRTVAASYSASGF